MRAIGKLDTKSILPGTGLYGWLVQMEIQTDRWLGCFESLFSHNSSEKAMRIQINASDESPRRAIATFCTMLCGQTLLPNRLKCTGMLTSKMRSKSYFPKCPKIPSLFIASS